MSENARRDRSNGGLVVPQIIGAGDQRFGAVEGSAVDIRNADYTYAAGDVIAYVAALGTPAPQGFETLASPWHCLGWQDTSGGIFTLTHTTKDIGAAGSLSAIRTVTTGGTKTLQVTCLEAMNPYVRSLYDDVPVTALQTTTRTDTAGITSGSTVVTDTTTKTTDVGASVTGTGIPAGTTIATVTPGTSFTLSAAATATSATTSLSLTNNYSAYVMPEVPADNRYCLLLDTIDGTKAQRLFSPNAKVTARGNDQIQQADAETLQMTFTFYPTTITLAGVAYRGELVRYLQYPQGEVPTGFTM
jgi:hypothetical protein